MALFESYERREKKILSVLKEYGIKSIEECKEITDKKGIDVDKIVRGTQPICFENAVWASASSRVTNPSRRQRVQSKSPKTRTRSESSL